MQVEESELADSQKINTSSSLLKELGPDLDADIVGIAALGDWKGTRLEESALRLLPQAKSVVVIAKEIYPETLDLTTPERIAGAASLNDVFTHNSAYLNARLNETVYDITRAFHQRGLKALPLPATGNPYDARFQEAVFSFKHAAEAAGLGKMGWHSLLLTPEFGPRIRITCCLTEAELETTKRDYDTECAGCGICLEICPAKALFEPEAGEPYAINKYACCSFLSAGGGCSQCMKLCPRGR